MQGCVNLWSHSEHLVKGCVNLWSHLEHFYGKERSFSSLLNQAFDSVTSSTTLTNVLLQLSNISRDNLWLHSVQQYGIFPLRIILCSSKKLKWKHFRPALYWVLLCYVVYCSNFTLYVAQLSQMFCYNWHSWMASHLCPHPFSACSATLSNVLSQLSCM